ncbi:FG-GAP-like repeat-containing protein [Pseudoruegeria sp. SHC-113]|uniref:FG-GAP-like repeat-containing protein n=1 Tax=Pseudoruegeria sp. SHC-113 TaxID=2855439 RepID=UPI0021BA7D01|nr:FG-GAP-like repeat-containing protein [Pseudoruegeria sp. SHC-113]MCT8161684.1 VCBS repeat-containing protein [Pseudoruegeria sp. SHC-113]
MQQRLFSLHARTALALLIVALLAYLFWTQSRYPALDDKALMSGAIVLEDPISFDVLLPTSPEQPLWQRIAYSTVNWLNTNKKGMTFGVLFGAALLTLFGTMSWRSFRGGFANSALGLAIGAPLGVCVNCAAPIAKGLYASGLRAETTLSAMVASPTLNVVVLTMLFSLLPAYMVLAKIGLSLLVILVVVPLICRLLPGSQLQIAPPPIPAEGWAEPAPRMPLQSALWDVAKSFAANLWFILRTTVPLMFLAGFLGAVAGHLLPPELLSGTSFMLGLAVLVAVAGIFLPVPIAFDVVIAGALLSSGLSVGYVMVLLFTLGIFSVYSFLIVARTISTRAAVLLSAAIVALGVLGGAGAQAYHDWQNRRALDYLLSEAPAPRLLMAAQASEAAQVPVRVTATAHAPRSAAGPTPFTRIEASEIGIDKPLEFDFEDMWPPFWEGRSLATGDIDGDGLVDVVIASTRKGLYAYRGDGNGGFTPLDLELGPVAEMPVFNAPLVDLDGDGDLDLFLATYRQGNWIWPNAGGFTQAEPPRKIEDGGAVLSIALSFGDIDRDGDLDAALGNWTAGWYRRVPGEESRNRLLLNTGAGLLAPGRVDLPAIPGETLSILLSDLSQDGWPDLIVGNDFEIPDAIYLSDGQGGLRLLGREDGLIPHTTHTTMAVKTADLENRGIVDLYLAQIAGRSSNISATLKMQPLERYCDGIRDPEAKRICTVNMEIKRWYKSGNNFDPTYARNCDDLPAPTQAQCKAMLIKDIAIQKEDPSLCGLIPAGQPLAASFCELHFLPAGRPSPAALAAALPQIKQANVLLRRPEAGAGFADEAPARGLSVGGWSWDTKIEDFDNDGDLDVYIVNGTWVPNEVSPSNLFFENDGQGQFTEASGPFGLEDYLMTATAVAFDPDGDGDLDLLTHPVNGPLVYFRNNDQAARAITVRLRDTSANSAAIGAVLRLSAGGGTQQRELQLGGGFMSFDAPMAHFGLGAAAQADALEITWPDGAVSLVAGPLAAGQSYLIERQP